MNSFAAKVLFIFLFGLSIGIGYFPEIATADDNVSEFEEADDSLDGFEEESFEGFEEGGGFEDVEINLENIEIESIEPSFYTLSGYFKEEIDYSHAQEDPDFSKLRSTLNLNLDLKLGSDWIAQINWNGFYDYSYTYRGRDEFTDEVLETYESEYEFRDAYVDGGLTSWMRIKFGRQIIVWGQSDSAQITDVANPQDQRELGMVDLEDARIPVTATKLSFLMDSWELNLVGIHEIRGPKFPAEGSEFDVFQELRQTGVQIEDEEIPESSAENTEYLIRLFKTFNGGDVGVVWADVYDDSVYMDFTELQITVIPSPAPSLVSVTPKHKRIKVLGFSGNKVFGSWLIKAEAAKKTGVAIARNDLETQLTDAVTYGVTNSILQFDEDSGIITSWSEKDILQGMIGFEYSGISDLTVAVEAVGKKVEDYEENLNDREISGQFAMIANYSALNDTFGAQLFWIHFTDSNGDVYRINVDYDIVDAFNISGGFIAYEASEEDALVYPFKDNDRVFAGVKYSF